MIDLPKAKFIGNPTLEYDVLDSTNTFTQDLVSKSNPTEGTVVYTHFQTAGKGQYGRKWASKPLENITLSIILYPSFLLLVDQFYLNVITSLSVAQTLAYFQVKKITIKWPNDVYIGINKVSGILIQNNLSGKQITSAVVGIGININQDNFLKELPNPTSLKIETCQTQNLKEVRDVLFSYFEKYYLKLKQGKQTILLEEYRQKLYRRGMPTRFKIDDQIIDGLIHSVNDKGQLEIEISGELKSFSKTEIQYLK